ncbi:unnamed protein product [Leptidea sinapis]|uniref:Uncharacterized protein n=1 Tax=Leptidea sinapis TaxID=189913 RepID=A0A5E4QMJ8_9NEOP|nr:unnamed protein product [Leptidea sinapis]
MLWCGEYLCRPNDYRIVCVFHFVDIRDHRLFQEGTYADIWRVLEGISLYGNCSFVLKMSHCSLVVPPPPHYTFYHSC